MNYVVEGPNGTVQPGTIGLTTIAGDVGKLIAVGEWLNGQGFWPWEHSFMVLPDGNILEAEPGGAVIRPFHYADVNVHWCESLYKLLPQPLNESRISLVADQLKGTPYSFLDYAALATHRLHIPAPGLKKYVNSTGHMICSQMDTEFYKRLGAVIFPGEWPGYVTPAGLYLRDRQLSRETS